MSISKPQTKGAAQASLIGAAPPTPHGSGLLVNHTRYDSLGRLRYAFNPERGASRYKYDNNGNQTERLEADSTKASSVYDALNRRTTKSYLGSTGATLTPTGTWCYDGKTYSAPTSNCGGATVMASYGKVTGYGSSVSATAYSHDSLGRLLSSSQFTPPAASAATFTYSYYIDDSLASAQYPSAKTIVNCYDEQGRPTWVSKVKATTVCTSLTPVSLPADAYATNVQYEAHGGMKQLQLGNGYWESADYNTRHQPNTMRLGSTSSNGDYWQQGYSYIHAGAAGTTNNGNIKQITQLVGGATITTNYAYDSVNRLCNAAENGSGASGSCTAAFTSSSWQQRYDYDAQGNRTITASTLAPTSYTASTYNSSNRITNSGFTYDGRGNVNGMPGSTATDKFFFDAEDRQITYCPTTTATCTDNAPNANRTIYGYDAEGKRVSKQSAANGNVRYIYDGQGKLAVEDGTVTLVSGIAYLTQDHLGSVRVTTGGVLERHDYLPFGEEITVASGNPRFGVAGYGVDQVARQKFTGKLRDNETGLDYFGARYFSGAMGRFTGPDENFADQHQDDPQSWNLYAYGRNNPLNNLDDDGRAVGKAVKLVYKAAKSAYKDGSVAAGLLEDVHKVSKAFGSGATKEEVFEAAKSVAGYIPVVGEVIDIVDVAASIVEVGTKTYSTYTKVQEKTGVVYGGRTSGEGTPAENVANRDKKHKTLSEQGFGPAKLDKSSTNLDAIRGREEQLILKNGGPKSRPGGTSANKYGGVGLKNPNRNKYLEAARRAFGLLE